MDDNPSKISGISSAIPSYYSREIKRNEYILPNEILKNKQKFFNLIHRYHNKLEDYSSRLRVSSSTLAITLRNIFKYHPNYRFTYDELFNLLVKALDSKEPIKNLADVDTERAIKKPQINEKILNRANDIDKFSRASAAKPHNEIESLEEMRFSDKLSRLNYLENNPNVPKQIQSNRNFASWLLSNPAALGSMISKPEFTIFFINALNPRMAEKYSPVFFSQVAVLIGQLLKLRQGKVWGEVGLEEEETLEKARTIAELESDDHNNKIVTGVKNVINTIPIKSLKDFLLEAERFVEEEIAMFYSVQKHLENEILKQMNKNNKNKK